MKLSYLWHGLPGHPIHPPLTDATIGIYTFATIAAFIDVVGITHSNGAYGWWIALVVGLIATVFTALTGFADWLTLEWGSEIWKTATIHMFAMVSATIFFALAAIFGHASYTHGDVSAGAFVLTLIGFGLLTLGGWLGGTIVFVYGMRVLSLVNEPASRGAAPVPHPERSEPRAHNRAGGLQPAGRSRVPRSVRRTRRDEAGFVGVDHGLDAVA